ncbi:DUF2804 family protein [Tessaracoccus sp.]|uniref:DUF2804 family protein n=1 Tax=Tessaracoccus sp. TaxID=1971211 RepID=UPI002606637A|nr:DUF2804 family protein [Tessaracoccus sp.]
MTLDTPWTAAVDRALPLPEHPRPQLVRPGWTILNGPWRYAVTPFTEDDPTAVPHPGDAPRRWHGEIVVPFSPEVPLSGVGHHLQRNEVLWYQRTFAAAPADGRRVLLHFGAVDQSCRVAVDGVEVGGHTGGYLPFTLDITDALAAGTEHTLTVAVRDVTDSSWLSRGKQRTQRGGIWYTPQSGIWQTVWLEEVPTVAIDRLVLTPHLASGEVEVLVLSHRAAPGQTATVRIDGVTPVQVRVGAPSRISLPAPVRAWSPDDPFLYDVEVTLGDDQVTSYVGMRSFGVGTGPDGRPHLLLNGEPHLPVGLLDQGYWPDGGYTAPTDEALAYDIELAKSLGFDLLRKHIKVEPLRWYHHCDRLGMLVWQDHVSGGAQYKDAVVAAPAIASPRVNDRRYRWFGRGDAEGRESSRAELRAMIEHLRSVPSVSLWVPFNEAWGQFDAAAIAKEVRAWDPTRRIDHASGWHDQGEGDLESRHIYFQRIKGSSWRHDGRVAALTEYGGYGLTVPGHLWAKDTFGYRQFDDAEALGEAFEKLADEQVAPAIRDGLSALVYTQLSDVEDEVNGLVTYDRQVVKLPVERVRATNDRLRAAFWERTRVVERELTSPVSLTGPDGRFNPAAHGWARDAVVDSSAIDGGRAWGRNKRWEYWNVITPTHILALTVSALDFASVNEIWIHERTTGRSLGHTGIGAGSRGVRLPANLEGGRALRVAGWPGSRPSDGVATARVNGLRITVEEVHGGTRLRADLPGAGFDVVALRPPGHERLAVVVPWSATRFQYTVKDVARPAVGTVTVDGVTHNVPEGESWAVLDHGRGRWPHDAAWNWGAGSGRLADGRVFGLQVGAQWTDGTGSTENAVLVDERLIKISAPVTWTYDLVDWRRPWRVVGGGLDATLVPFHNKQSSTNFGVLASRTSQVFGHWVGTFDTGAEVVAFDGIVGFGEDVRNRW